MYYNPNVFWGYFSTIVSCSCYFLVTSIYSRTLSDIVLTDYFLFYNAFSQIQILLSHLFLNSNQSIFISWIQQKEKKKTLILIRKILPLYLFCFFFCCLFFNFFLHVNFNLNYIINTSILSIFCILFTIRGFLWVIQNKINFLFKMYTLQSLSFLIFTFLFLRNIHSINTIMLLLALSYFVANTLLGINLKETSNIIKTVFLKKHGTIKLRIYKHNLYLDSSLFISNTPSVVLSFFISSNDLLMFLMSFRIYELSCMIPQKYLDSQQGLIMQAFGNKNQEKALYLKLRATHFILSLCNFIFILLGGKFFLHFWLGIDLSYKLFIVLAIFSLLKNMKLFFYTFLFCLNNRFCKFLARINWLENFIFIIGFLFLKPHSSYCCYFIYITCTLFSFLLFRKHCFLYIYPSLKSQSTEEG